MEIGYKGGNEYRGLLSQIKFERHSRYAVQATGLKQVRATRTTCKLPTKKGGVYEGFIQTTLAGHMRDNYPYSGSPAVQRGGHVPI
jgi:hypothetical protein